MVIGSCPVLKSKNVLMVIDTLFKVNNDATNYRHNLEKAKNGKFGKVDKMSIYLRLAVMNIKLDPYCAMYWITKARRHATIKRKSYSSVDTILFYCCYTWACLQVGRPAQAISGIQQIERCILDDRGVWASGTTVLRRARVLLIMVSGTALGRISDAADNLVNMGDVVGALSLTNSYEIINLAFKNNKPVKRKLLHYRTYHRHKLCRQLTDAYLNLEAPLCGAYVRHDPNMRTVCINEFLSVFTDEPRRAEVTEQDVGQLEEKYSVVFNAYKVKLVEASKRESRCHM